MKIPLLLPSLTLALVSGLAPAAPAQGTLSPTNVGLTISGAGMRFGVVCGTFDCMYVRGAFPAGTRTALTAFGPPRTPFAIGISPPSNACIRIRGLDGALRLGRPIITHAVGLIGMLDPNTPCRQGRTSVPLGIPPNLRGFAFAIQSVGINSMSNPIHPNAGPRPGFSNPLLIAVR